MNKPKSKSSSSPEPTPIMMLTPAKKECDPRKMQLVPASRFGLPEGWTVEERPRSSSHVVDKYYMELHTGLKFRSLIAVHRYLTNGEVDIRTRIEKPGRQCIMPPFRRSSFFTLPDGWEVEEKPRQNTLSKHIDKYYIEPGTGKRFRSLISVEKYLTEENEDTPVQALVPANKTIVSGGSVIPKKKMKSLELISDRSPCLNECYNSALDAMELNDYLTPATHPSSPKKITCGESSRPTELTNGRLGSPPRSVKWVLGGPGGNMWNPFMDDSKVADSVRHRWYEVFISSICDENAQAPRS